MFPIRRAALCLAATCYAAVTSMAAAADNSTSTTATPVLLETTSTNTTTATDRKDGYLLRDLCVIDFWYWDHDFAPRFDIFFVHTKGRDHTDELFDGGSKPIHSSNMEYIDGQLDLVQIWPGERMVCISAIRLECGRRVSGFAEHKWVTITADTLQQSWIYKTGQRKPVDWGQGPCMYFRSAPWDSGAFRALDIYTSAFNCGDDYYCIARNIETFGN